MLPTMYCNDLVRGGDVYDDDDRWNRPSKYKKYAF